MGKCRYQSDKEDAWESVTKVASRNNRENALYAVPTDVLLIKNVVLPYISLYIIFNLVYWTLSGFTI